jgi:dihydroxyacetone kinase
VLAAIVTVSSVEAGCLLIVKNYTGDRLNFGIAAQLALSRFNIKCETVYVADDVALEKAAQPRGLVRLRKGTGDAAREGDAS